MTLKFNDVGDWMASIQDVLVRRRAPAYGRRLAANVLAATLFARLVIILPGCCAAWSYGAIAVAIAAALVAAVCMFWATAIFLATPRDARHRSGARWLTGGLGAVVGAIGTEALWTVATYAPDPLLTRGLQAGAIVWAVCGAALIWRRARSIR